MPGQGSQSLGVTNLRLSLAKILFACRTGQPTGVHMGGLIAFCAMESSHPRQLFGSGSTLLQMGYCSSQHRFSCSCSLCDVDSAGLVMAGHCDACLAPSRNRCDPNKRVSLMSCPVPTPSRLRWRSSVESWTEIQMPSVLLRCERVSLIIQSMVGESVGLSK